MGKYYGYNEGSAASHKKYMAQFVELRARVSRDERDAIQAHAQEQGESVNRFINRAIRETMQRDKTGAGE